MVSIFVLVVILFLVVLLLFSFKGNRVLPLQPHSKVLLITAHPDDEVMFFSPVVRGLRMTGHRVFFLCVSTGSYYGLVSSFNEICQLLSFSGPPSKT